MARVPITEAALGAGVGGSLIALTGASMQVNVHGGAAATVYLDESSGTTVTNPLTSTNGRVTGWLSEGVYDLVVTYGGVTAPAVVFNARAAYPSGATDGQVLTYNTATTSPIWSDANSIAANLPWKIDINAFGLAATNTNWSTLTQSSSVLMGGRRDSTAAQNAAVGWDCVMSAGTWTLQVIANKTTDSGIITVTLDGTSIGTIDTYNGTNTENNLLAIAGFVVATTGKKRLLFTMATKNASSSSYAGRINCVMLTRTA